jgi:hypothetical protein
LCRPLPELLPGLCFTSLMTSGCFNGFGIMRVSLESFRFR